MITSSALSLPGISAIVLLGLFVADAFRGWIQVNGHNRMLAAQHDAPAHLRFLFFQKRSQLLLRWSFRQNQLIGFRAHWPARARRPRQHFAHERVFHRRDQVRRQSLVEPARMAEVPWFEMRVRKSPTSHLLYSPVRR